MSARLRGAAHGARRKLDRSGGGRQHAGEVLGNFVKRGVNMAVLGLAALTFFLFPIGGKTPFQHAVAIFTSRPAREAGASFASAGRRAAASVRAEVKKLLDSNDPPKHPAGHSP